MAYKDHADKVRWTEANRAKAAARSRAWARENAERRRDSFYQRKYGITLSDYNKILESQNGLCAICFQSCVSGHNLCVDHDHHTLEVRGLLCKDCNNGIGRLKDDTMLLQSAINYLKEHHVDQTAL